MWTRGESRNFAHLREIDEPLAVLATHAERYFVDDANTALIKTRQFAERLARRCCQTDANSSRFRQVRRISGGAETAPLGESGGAGLLVDWAAGEAPV